MNYSKMVQPAVRPLLQVAASTITAAAAVTTWAALLPAGPRFGRMAMSRARHRRGRS
jgi:hypothetical protein